MTFYSIDNPFQSLTTTAGVPLTGGRVYIGLVNQDPETNPQAVYWDEDGSTPANQPLDTKGGYIVRSGAPAIAYTSTPYSIRVRDKQGVEVYYLASVSSELGDFVALLTSGAGANSVGFIQDGSGAVAETVQTELRKRITYGQHGTLAQSIALAGSTRDIDMAGQSVTLGAAPTNTYGARFTDGKVLIPSGVSTYTYQQNTYADDANGIMIARENLATWWKYVSADLFQNIFMYGDSTVITNGLYSYKPHTLFKMALMEAGVNNCLTVNEGVAGTSWGDLNCLGDLGPTTRLIVIKYGINDAVLSNNLATMAAAMRAKLAAIRADADGGFDQLSILLMGPNSTFAPQYGQDSKWYESIRNLYLQICKEFDCAYFDTYAYLQSTHRAPGLWLLEDFPPDQGIHPDQVAVFWIWYEGVKNHVLGDGAWNVQKSNHLFNVDHGTVTRLVTEEPQLYEFGWHQYGVLKADGPGPTYWPADGQLIVHRSASGGSIGQVTQQLFTLDQVPLCYVRTGTLSTWTQWTVIPDSITATKTWDPPSVADGATTSTTITLTGVSATDRIIASLSSITAAGWFITAVRSAADTISVTLFNKTGGTVDLASGTLTVTALRTS